MLMNSKLMEGFNLIDKQFFDDIFNFLELVQEVVEALSVDQQPTLH